jgi:hypothetical protein
MSGVSKHFSFKKNNLKNHQAGRQAGSPKYSPTPKLNFCDLKPHAKFQKPMITPSERIVSVASRWPSITPGASPL